MCRVDQVFIGESYIRVRYYYIGIQLFSVFKENAYCFAILYKNFFYFSLKVELSTLFLNKFFESTYNGSGSSHCIMHSPFSFKIVDHCIDRGSVKRISPH